MFQNEQRECRDSGSPWRADSSQRQVTDVIQK